MKTINKEYYGDDVRWFVATVIDASPPRGLEGRIKIRIHGIHSPKTFDIPQRDLPWAQVMSPSTSFGVSGLGWNTQIQAGALVFGIFLDGKNSQLPMVMGSLPRVEFPSIVQAEHREDPSTNPFALDFIQDNSQYEGFRATENTRVFHMNIARFFIDNGFNVKQASSITGIIEEISGNNPSQTRKGFGLGGWVLGTERYKRFITYISRLNPSRDENDAEGQLMFIMNELQTTHTIAWSKMLRSQDIEGSFQGEKIDGINDRGNGMVALLHKYYIDPTLRLVVNKGNAEGNALRIWGALGAR